MSRSWKIGISSNSLLLTGVAISAISISPRSSFEPRVETLASSTCRCMSGWLTDRYLNILGKRYGATVEIIPNEIFPTDSPFLVATSSLTCAALNNTRFTRLMISSPTAVGFTGWLLRSNIVTSSSVSSFWTSEDKVDCETPHDSAAFAKWRYLSTAAMYSICWSVI